MTANPEKTMPPAPRRKIAIVGGGISGMACSWELRKHDCIVDIYELDKRLGGHANSVPFEGNGRKVNVDTGFIVMEEDTYPQFNAFLGELGVHTIPTDMSFGVSTADAAFEWGSYSISSFIGKRSHLFSPWFWRLVFDVVRFSLFAREILDEEQQEGPRATGYKTCSSAQENAVFGDNDQRATSELSESIGTYLRRQRYSEQFITYYLIPMAAAPWCSDVEEFARTFPAKHLIRFMLGYGLLDTVTKTLRWRSFRGGSKTYVDAFQRSLPSRHKLHVGTAVQKVTRVKGGAVLEFADEQPRKTYDHIVLAVHAWQALRLLGDQASSLERKVLSSFKTTENICYLHSDTSFLPRRPSARVAWNCFLSPGNSSNDSMPLSKHTTLRKSSSKPSKICITYDMNKLQSIPFPGESGSPGRVLVSLNPPRSPRSPQSSHVYHHPLVSAESIRMAAHLHKVNGVAGISFAGAWMGSGFHEDGFTAGVRAACLAIEGGEDLCGRGNDARTSGLAGTARTTGVKDKSMGMRLVEVILRLWIHAVQLLIMLCQQYGDASVKEQTGKAPLH